MFHAGNTILEIINNEYEGGAAKFEQDGGRAAPYPDDRGVIIFQLNMDETFKKKLLSYSSEEYKIEVTGIVNVIQPMELISFTYALSKAIPQAAVMVNPVAIYVTIPEESNHNLHVLAESIIRDQLPTVNRAFILFLNKYERFNKDDMPVSVTHIQPPAVAIESETVSKRLTTIQPDEITNLRIELALCKDVQQFIDSI